MTEFSTAPPARLCLRRECEHHTEAGWSRPVETRPRPPRNTTPNRLFSQPQKGTS